MCSMDPEEVDGFESIPAHHIPDNRSLRDTLKAKILRFFNAALDVVEASQHHEYRTTGPGYPAKSA